MREAKREEAEHEREQAGQQDHQQHLHDEVFVAASSARAGLLSRNTMKSGRSLFVHAITTDLAHEVPPIA